MDIINICHETVSMCDTKYYIENYNKHYNLSKVDSVNDLGVRLAGGKMQNAYLWTLPADRQRVKVSVRVCA